MNKKSAALPLIALSALAALSIALPAGAQSTKSPHQSGRPPLTERPVGDKAILRTMADAVGMIRGVGPFESVKTINRLQWNGSGVVQGVKADYSYSLSLALMAAREDVRPKDGGRRTVEVVNGAKAWNEVTPGVGMTPADGEVLARRAKLDRTPFAFSKAAFLATPGSVVVTDPGGSGPVTVTMPIDGIETTAVLDTDFRPRTVTQTVNGRKIEVTYTDYADLSEYGLMFPQRIVEKTDGKTTMDVKVTDVRVASYAIFDPPTQ